MHYNGVSNGFFLNLIMLIINDLDGNGKRSHIALSLPIGICRGVGKFLFSCTYSEIFLIIIAIKY